MAVIQLKRSPNSRTNPKGATSNCATSSAKCFTECRRRLPLPDNVEAYPLTRSAVTAQHNNGNGEHLGQHPSLPFDLSPGDEQQVERIPQADPRDHEEHAVPEQLLGQLPDLRSSEAVRENNTHDEQQ